MDDIEYLQAHGVEQTYVFLADSSQRDTAVYPTASEYDITFNAPFRNVVKFELLEVNIARTDYLVDSSENTLTYSLDTPTSIATWASDVAGNVRTVTVPPGDYNFPQLVDELNSQLANVANAYSDATVVQVAQVTTPYDISNKIRFEASAPFCILASSSTMRTTLGLADPVDLTSTGYSSVPGYSLNYPNGASGVFVGNVAALVDGVFYPALTGPLPSGGDENYEGIYTPGGNARIVQQFFQATASGVPSSVSAFLANLGSSPPSGGYVVDVAVAYASNAAPIATGQLVAGGSDFVPTTAQLNATGQLVAGDRYVVQFTPSTTTPANDAGNCAALWYNFSNLPVLPSTYAAINGVEVHTGQSFCTDLAAGAWGYSIAPDGIVNLRGARYVKIRCPTLEQFISRDRVGEPTTAGIGLVDLIGYGYQNQRYQFVHYPAEKFHPIGRVQKLTFRLERPDGTLYNTQGVDNTLLCALTYVNVPQRTGLTTHPAAPGYTPDFVKIQRDRYAADAKATYAYKKPGACPPGPR